MKKLKKILSFLIVAIVSMWAISTDITAATINLNGVDIIYTNPGEDCSTEMTISWHSSTLKSTLTYTLATDTDYSDAIKVDAVGVYDNTSFIYYDKASFYKSVVKLTDLIPDTEYIYKVSNSAKTSEEHKFKTAGTSDFTFGYMSDIHAIPYDNLDLGMTAVDRMKTVQKLLDNATNKTGGLDFILTTGDEVWRGSQYSNWLEWSKTQYTTALNDYMWAGAVGNHEYYTQFTDSVWNYYPDKWKADSDRDKIYSDKESYYNTYYNAVKSVPSNGPEGNPATYWYLYNNVLFIALDSMQADEYGKLDSMHAWFEDVVLKNEGKYQYIVVYQHYPWYDFQTGSAKSVNDWSELFDKYGVDLALSGHMHGYLRTNAIYNKKNATDGNGTVYVVSPQVGDRPKSITGYSNQALFAARMETTNLDDYSAMSAITVTKDSMTYKLVDTKGNVLDQFTITAKREYNLESSAKEAVSSSITASASNDTAYIDIDKQYFRYVSEMKLIKDNQVVATIKPATTKNCTLIDDNLTVNHQYKYNVEITFIDSTSIKKEFTVSTADYYGEVFNFKATVINDKVKLTWEDDLKNNIIANYKILKDDVEIITIASTINSYEIDKSSCTLETKYTIQGLTSNNEIVYEDNIYYDLYGDINFDGTINNDDTKLLLNYVINGVQIDSNTLKIIDINKDGIANTSDATTICAFVNQKTQLIKEYTYTVIFIDSDGQVLNTQEVTEGENAVSPSAPNKSGYTFSHWSISSKAVDCNLIIRPIYEESK